jgi:hypothetical protein
MILKEEIHKKLCEEDAIAKILKDIEIFVVQPEPAIFYGTYLDTVRVNDEPSTVTIIITLDEPDEQLIKRASEIVHNHLWWIDANPIEVNKPIFNYDEWESQVVIRGYY